MQVRTVLARALIAIVSLLAGSIAMAQANTFALPARSQTRGPVGIPHAPKAPVAVTSLKPAEAGDLLLQSHVVFAESWRLLQLQSGSTPNSIFKVLSQHLVKDAASSICPKSGLSWQVEQKSTSMSVALKSCEKNKNLFPASVAATISWQAPMHSFELIANTDQFREVVGDSLAMLNPQLQCKGHWGKDFLLVDLSCKNLGLGLERSTHVLYQTFNYNSVAKSTDATMLLVEADQYVNLVSRQLCDSAEPCLKLRVPGRGKIASRKDLRHVVLATNSLPPPNLAPVANPVPVRKTQAAVDPNINPNSDFYDKSYAQDLPQTEKASQAAQQTAQKMLTQSQASQGQQGRIMQDPANAAPAQNQVANAGEQNVQLAGGENAQTNLQNGSSNEIQNGNQNTDQNNLQASQQNASEGSNQDTGAQTSAEGATQSQDPQQVASLEQRQGTVQESAQEPQQSTDVGRQPNEVQQASEQPAAHPATGPDAVPQSGVHIR